MGTNDFLTLASIIFTFLVGKKGLVEYQSIFFTEVQKLLSELEIKMKNLNCKTFRNFIEKMKDPKSYAPLIGIVVASTPIYYTLLASFGLTSS